jgi:glycosyltransferase involved in cell wall biosynthesis
VITVIVPTLNEEHYILPCLESVARQSPPPDEILVVDNGSTDRTVEVVKEFSAAHPQLNVKITYEARKGCDWAREAGWRAATGDVIIHVDADETMPLDWLGKVRTVLRDNPELAAFGGTVRFENPPLSILILQGLYNLLYPRMVHWTKGFPYLCGGMTICKREVLEKMNGYANKPSDQLEDYYLSEQAHKLGYKTRYFPSIYGYHSLRRYHDGGLAAFLKWGVAGLDAAQYDANVDVR